MSIFIICAPLWSIALTLGSIKNELNEIKSKIK